MQTQDLNNRADSFRPTREQENAAEVASWSESCFEIVCLVESLTSERITSL